MPGKHGGHGPLEHPFLTTRGDSDLMHYFAKDKSTDRRSDSSYFPLQSPLLIYRLKAESGMGTEMGVTSAQL